MLAFFFGIPVAVFLVVLVYGGLTGRVKLTSCCAVADPRRDLRMRAAFHDDDALQTAERQSGPPEA